MEEENKAGYADDFPSSANEPVFEALPDYRLATDDLPLFETGENKLATAQPGERLFDESTLDEKTLTELEAFIARARALKGRSAPVDETAAAPAAKPRQQAQPAAKRQVSFEVDFGDGRVEQLNKRKETAASRLSVAVDTERRQPSFEFAFAPTATGGETNAPAAKPAAAAETITPDVPVRPARKQRETKTCPDCEMALPVAARFCFSCGYPQPDEDSEAPLPQSAPVEDVLILEELPAEPAEEPKLYAMAEAPTAPETEPFTSRTTLETERIATPGRTAKTTGAISTRKYTMAELKQAFREHFQEKIIAYFGEPKLKKYYAALEENTVFQQLRDGSLTNLLNWINGGERTYSAVAKRIDGTMADLTEYFIVETAGSLSGNVLPQRLLRHQSVNWETVDLFKLVMDFLDFEAETERVYTDFVAMPARALRNATNSFLRAGKDERIFFICDQSLISQAKNGFALTDAGVYWKNVLQPAGSALFTTMERVSLTDGHLDIDGQFFNAGARLNLKMAVLLDKLRRMD